MITATLSEPLHGGALPSAGTSTAISADVPAFWPVSLGEHGYVLDLSEYTRQSVDVLRQQADQSAEPGEASFSPMGMWRRSVESWHRGAGQEHLDIAEDSERSRFDTSKGIDPWERGRLCLLNRTALKRASTAANLKLLAGESRVWLVDGASLLYSTDLSTWTAVTGLSGVTITSAATDGDRVWVTDGVSTSVISSAGSMSSFSVSGGQLVAYATGRLLLGSGASLYELDSAGATTTLFTHPNSNFRWDAICGSVNGIYVSGHVGANGELFRIGIEDASTALGVPTIATQLPDGEWVTSLAFYVGAVILGTNRGVRVATIDTAGFLTYGPLAAETSPVYALEPQDRFCWFGWSSYDSTDSGLGRVDLSTFTASLRPAYASDLMAGVLGTVSSVVTFAGVRVFTVDQSGVYGEIAGESVPSGQITSGLLRFGTTVRKLVESVDVRHDQLPTGGQVEIEVASENGTWVDVATVTDPGFTGPDAPYAIPDLPAEAAQVRLTLSRATDLSSPCIRRWTVEAIVIPPRAERILAPFVFAQRVELGDGDGKTAGFDPGAEFAYLKALERAGRPVDYVEGGYTWRVVLEQVAFKPSSWNDLESRWLNGTCFVRMVTVES